MENKLRNLGNSALRELAQRIQRDMENLPGMSDEEMKQEAEEIANALGSLPNASEDERLQNLTRFFEQMATSEEPSKGKSMAAAALAEAMELVEQFFWKKLRRNFSAGIWIHLPHPVVTKGKWKNIFVELRRGSN